MSNVLRLPFNVCCRPCTTWKRRLCASLFLLGLLSLSVFSLTSSGPRTREVYVSPDEEETAVEFTPSWLFSKNPGIDYSDNDNGSLEKYVSPKPRDPKRRKSHGRRNKVPCSNLTMDSPRGPIEADLFTFPSIKELEANLSDQLQLGGHYIPTHCRPTQSVAIIVPYREREIHLGMFLKHMHAFLQRQQVEYYIVVVEQAEGTPFNRALLFNIGFYKMNKLHDIDCYIFHDVDLLPLDDRILYLCQDQPQHLSMLVDTLGNTLMYENMFGGVVALTPEMMETVNGFPNLFFGWGGEDDDMSYRVRHHGYSIERYSKEVSRYTMIKHRRSEDVDQGKLDRKVEVGRQRILEDGLNSLVFHLLEFQPLPLYTWMKIKPNASMLNIDAFAVKKVTSILD